MFALPVPLLLTSTVKTKLFSLSASTGPDEVVRTYPFSPSFLRGLDTPRQGALGLSAAVLGGTGAFTAKHLTRSPRRAGLTCICGCPHLEGASQCVPLPTPHLLLPLYSHSRPNLHHLLKSVGLQGSAEIQGPGYLAT